MLDMRQISVFLCVVGALQVAAFPDGAPVDVCVKPRPNEPYHGEARAQPINSLPYQVTASSGRFQPGQQITVTIKGNVPFKGFFMQARDSANNEWIGSFADTPNTKTFNECSSVTHTDGKNKQQATLIWNAPLNSRGQVYFTGSIVKDFTTYWANVVAKVQQQRRS